MLKHSFTHKNGYPVKTAIVSIIDDTITLVNGSLYIIVLDTTRVYPYYVKAYLTVGVGIIVIRK